MSQPEYYVVSRDEHDALVQAAYEARGYDSAESAEGTKLCAEAARHGIRTHNALKALHLDHLFGSATGGCVPSAEITKIEGRFKGSEVWDANLKLGQSVAYRAIDRCIELADEYGIGQVSVDNAFHYLWGGGYMFEAARRGYIAYTNCTSTLAEVVPFGGKTPTLGTNPHSWGFPTFGARSYPMVIDWATSTVAMGRVQQLKREGKELPPMAAVDADGNPTQDPNAVAALLPFGMHKGYGLSLINEIVGAYIGGSLPTIRGKADQKPEGEKTTSSFYFQVIHPDAMNSGHFAKGRNRDQNVQAVIDDIFQEGNEKAIVPGAFEAAFQERSDAAGGLLFTEAELKEFNELAEEVGKQPFDISSLKRA